jgi:catechol 2,3-dioxygenase-like lactoylglutathione lyase family enzyme
MDGEISNIVIACPEGAWNERTRQVEGPPRDLALFYAELLGLEIVREDWLRVGRSRADPLHLAFGDGPTDEYLPPRWGDAERPAQARLEIPVRDLPAAERLAVGLGATAVEDGDGRRTCLDPVGHPFCLYLDADVGDPTQERPLSGRIGRVVFDCFSPRSLARFWSELLDMPVLVEDTPRRVVVARRDGRLPMLGFRHSVGPAPRWPDPRYPQQVHLDVYFDDGPAAQDLAERLGAMRLPAMGGSCPVYADPAGHPFCLCRPGE